MRLNGLQFRQLTDALMEAFPEQIRLAEVLRFKLDKNLNVYAMGQERGFTYQARPSVSGLLERRRRNSDIANWQALLTSDSVGLTDLAAE